MADVALMAQARRIRAAAPGPLVVDGRATVPEAEAAVAARLMASGANLTDGTQGQRSTPGG